MVVNVQLTSSAEFLSYFLRINLDYCIYVYKHVDLSDLVSKPQSPEVSSTHSVLNISTALEVMKIFCCLNIYFIVLGKCCRPFLWQGCKFVRLHVRIVCQ